MDKQKISAKIKEILRRNGIKKAFLFGSFTADSKEYNDVDILIDPPEGFSLLDLVRVEEEISKAIHRKTDLVSSGGITKRFRKHIKPVEII